MSALAPGRRGAEQWPRCACALCAQACHAPWNPSHGGSRMNAMSRTMNTPPATPATRASTCSASPTRRSLRPRSRRHELRRRGGIRAGARPCVGLQDARREARHRRRHDGLRPRLDDGGPQGGRRRVRREEPQAGRGGRRPAPHRLRPRRRQPTRNALTPDVVIDAQAHEHPRVCVSGGRRGFDVRLSSTTSPVPATPTCRTSRADEH